MNVLCFSLFFSGSAKRLVWQHLARETCKRSRVLGFFFGKFGATGWLQGMFVDLFSALASDDAKTAAGQFGRRPWGARSAAPG